MQHVSFEPVTLKYTTLHYCLPILFVSPHLNKAPEGKNHVLYS